MSDKSNVGHIVKKLRDRKGNQDAGATTTATKAENEKIIIDGVAYELKIVDVNELADNPFQYRITYDQDELQSLADSIKIRGLIHPVAYGTYKGKKVLAVGHRRKRATILAEKSSILAIDLGELTAKDLVAIVHTENEQREKVHPLEKSFSYRDILDSGVFDTQTELADSIGKSKSYMTMMLGYLKLSQEIINDLRENKSTWDTLALDMIRRVKDERKQNDIYYEFVNNKRDRGWLAEQVAIANNKGGQVNTKATMTLLDGNTLKPISFDTKKLSKTEQREFGGRMISLLKEFGLL
ncbi:ParB/RepB/Spo0J family partition protein [Thiomicrolovo sp. ZZH C-3]